jgi:hypothetical protein
MRQRKARRSLHTSRLFVGRNGACHGDREILEQWASKTFPTPTTSSNKASGKPIPYEELDLEQGLETFDIEHELTRKGIESFTADYRATLSRLHD